MTGKPNERTSAAATRRQHDRWSANDEVTVWADSGATSYFALIIDASEGGVGLVVDSTAPVQVGQRLRLIHHDCPLMGIVRYIEPDDPPHDERLRVGIEWLRPEVGVLDTASSDVGHDSSSGDGRFRFGVLWRNRKPTLNEASATTSWRPSDSAEYLSFGGLAVVCRVQSELQSGKLLVALAGGTRVEITADELVEHTFNERAEVLRSLELELTMLVGLYQLREHRDQQTMVQMILQYEFVDFVR